MSKMDYLRNPMNRPLCFVLMPFGKKPDLAGSIIDFDAVYQSLIAPAVSESGLEPLRADEEMTGGIIHKPMYERLILCEYAVADLTTANANVFYELGLRHAVRPWSTVLLFAEGGRLPFDVAPLRAMPYRLTPEGTPQNVDVTKAALIKRLVEARLTASEDAKAATDSPIYQLIENFPDIDHTKTDVFRDRVRYSTELKNRLAAARKEGVDALRTVETELGNLDNVESGVVIDLFLSYRGAKAWEDMIALVRKMPRPLAATVMVQEQLAFALNRAGRGEEAEKVLTELLAKRGPSSETYGILGRVYKDRWEAALNAGNRVLARGLLEKAIEAYSRGFEADWRDAYPGMNAVTLMELKEPPDSRRMKLIPVVAYAVERRVATGKADYWDHATLLELAVLAKDEDRAMEALGNALAAVREPFEPESTARNLRLIREGRERRGEIIAWSKEIEDELQRRSGN
ncbi:MAG: TRAFs-binding domain-containing protein [Nitrospiraceae bacterium]